MKPQVLKTRLGKSLSVFLVLSACSTYRTFDPRADQAQAGQLDQQHQIQSTTTTQAPAFSTYKDETANQYGEPYFLPKGLIHLVIKPEAGSGGSASSGTSGTPPANSNVITITSGTTTQTTGATQQQTLDDGLQPVAYQISVDSVMVPDLTTGPYFAHYEQNWFYSENIALGVTADGLLSTVSGTSTDKTPQIISNLVDTGIDLAEFAAQVGSFTAAAAPGGGGTTMNYANQVRYKRLNIDVTFDPFDPDQVENVGKLFHTVVAVDPGVTVGGTTYLVSPFTFAVNTIRTPELATSEEKLGTGQGKVSKPNADGSFRLTPKIPARNQQGLWFREMTPVEILLKQNPEEFRVNAKAVLEFNESNLAQNSDDTLNPQTAASQLQKAQQKESDAKDNLTRLNAILTALTNGKITSPLPTPKDLTDANDAINPGFPRFASQITVMQIC